jgi:hypothetical protein
MPFEPRAGDSGERERKEKQVQRPLHGLGRDAHPKRNLGKIRLLVDHPPQYAHYDKRERAQPQRLVELPVEVADVCVYALLGPSGAKCEGDQNKDRRRPVEELGHGSVARAVHHSVSPSKTRYEIEATVIRVCATATAVFEVQRPLAAERYDAASYVNTRRSRLETAGS